MEVQSVIFPRSVFDPKKARKWLKDHHLKNIKRVHVTEDYLRYRMREPDPKGNYITVEIEQGIKLIKLSVEPEKINPDNKI